MPENEFKYSSLKKMSGLIRQPIPFTNAKTYQVTITC